MANQDALMPNPLTSDRQYCRFYHLDLPELEDMELMDELHALRPLLWGLDSNHWLRERVKALEAEISKRPGDTSFRPSGRGQRKPKQAEGVEL